MRRRRFLRLGAVAALGAAGLGLALAGVQPPGRDEMTDLAIRILDASRRSLGIPAAAWARRIGEPLAHPARVTPAQPQIDDGYWQGLPLGGLGSGSVGRTYRGDFARWHLDVGRHHYETVPACQFAVRVADGDRVRATVLYAGRPRDRLTTWGWGYPAGRGTYYACFPKAWFDYDPTAVGCRLTIKQFSPVIPGNYRESSYPVGVFEATAHNPYDRPLTVSLMFTWQNLAGWDRGAWRHDGQRNRAVVEGGATGRIAGVVLDGGTEAVRERWDGQFAIACWEEPRTEVSFQGRFRADGDGADVWREFFAAGRLADREDPRPASPGEAIGGAVAVRFRLAPGERQTVPFALAWDLPIMQFGEDGRGRRWYRRYTAFYGTRGDNAWAIARDALAHFREWEAAIDAWQAPILEDPNKPDWYKMALFNELYYLVDGGTAWESGEAVVGFRKSVPTSDVRNPTSVGRFTYLECYDYPFYGTLDVRFYGSWALSLLWPELEKQEIRQFAATAGDEDGIPVTIESSRARSVRKRAGAMPHDLGAPDDDPWCRPNSYHWQDTNLWKDLNAKFVLQVYRDYVVTGDRALVADCWAAVKTCLAYLERFDRDGDGIPENDGTPDQTYDTWPATGASAYCGGLWLAALRAAEAMGAQVGDGAAVAGYQARRADAERAYDRLWNGRYYNYDSSGAEGAVTIMADQLCGAWYAQSVGLPDIVPAERVRAALRTVYEYNVRRFGGGRMGPVNGMRPDGTVDRTCDQSQEVWTGVGYALAAFLIQNGMVAEGLQTAHGIVDTIYRTKGLWFRTPEAWNGAGEFRASMYMRPQSIWAMEHAFRLRNSGRPTADNRSPGNRPPSADRGSEEEKSNHG
jgi:non-lysosomal glucosylceramidase